MDAAISCEHIYWTLVARAHGRLVYAAGPNPFHTGGVPRRPGLRDGWIRRQYMVLRSRFGAVSRFHCLPGLHLPGAHRTQDERAGRSSPEKLPADRLFPEHPLESAGLLPFLHRLWRSLYSDRKGAAAVNRELLDWLALRTQPERPFFAFLNYNDAHHPYELPPGRLHRFGVEPTNKYQRILLQDWCELDKTIVSREGVAFAAAAYDDCIADLDEQLGNLVDELDRRGVLERTWLIIASDHGESFGEHAGDFCHGTTLYETELHVPLLIIPPGGSATKQAVREVVSLRDLAATIVDVVGQQAGSPFPGVSLARFWKRPGPVTPIRPPSAFRRSPRWSCTTCANPITGVFPNNSPH